MLVKTLPCHNYVADGKYLWHQQYFSTGSPQITRLQTFFSKGVTTVSWLLFLHWATFKVKSTTKGVQRNWGIMSEENHTRLHDC